MNPDGSLTFSEEFPGFDLAETWQDNTKPNKHTLAGNFGIHTNLVTYDGDGSAYNDNLNNTLNPRIGDLQFSMGPVSYFTQFGEPAGIATDQFDTPLYSDSSIVEATPVIPEPGTLMYMVIAGVALAGLNKMRRESNFG
ncbi:MAG: hypothetical protein JJU29_22250 [Verrucomicrobia bacterium]|nr:hypothetical protein [Verrucomicrobiota bacterium]MCH8511327.1 hypothetical protein [Kiritimatiellia bacterium]